MPLPTSARTLLPLSLQLVNSGLEPALQERPGLEFQGVLRRAKVWE